MARPLPLAFIVVTTLIAVSLAAANPVLVPFVETVWFGPAGEVSLVMAPDGSGRPFAAAWNVDGDPVDATLRIFLVDDQHHPMPDVPADQIWLQFDVTAGTAIGCIHHQYSPGGMFFPDDASDDLGMMEWTLPLKGGGWSPGSVAIYFLGERIMTPEFELVAPLPIRVNSLDINGDLDVDLSDITLFVQDLGGPYHYRSDLHWDGTIDLGDIVLFAQGLGATCP